MADRLLEIDWTLHCRGLLSLYSMFLQNMCSPQLKFSGSSAEYTTQFIRCAFHLVWHAPPISTTHVQPSALNILRNSLSSRKRAQWVPLGLCLFNAKANSPRFWQNSPSLPQNSVNSLFRNSTLETVFSEVWKRGWREGVGDSQGPRYRTSSPELLLLLLGGHRKKGAEKKLEFLAWEGFPRANPL